MTLFVCKRQHYIILLKDSFHTRNHRKWDLTRINEATCDRWFALFCFVGKHEFPQIKHSSFLSGGNAPVSSDLFWIPSINRNAAASVPASVHCNITQNTLISCLWDSPHDERWLPVSSKTHPVLIPHPTSCYTMKPQIGLELQAALWMMAKISCQFLFGHVWPRTQTVSLCAQH